MYRYYNANPNNLEVEDCSIRCISALEGISWADAYKKLSNFGRKHGLMLNSVESIESYLDCFYDRVPIYEETVGEFIENHPTGRFAITMPSHITALIDSVNYDTFDSSEKIIWDAWEIC